MIDNDILLDYQPTGCKIGGVAQSRQNAKDDLTVVNAISDRFQGHNFPPALLIGLASRESQCGRLLDDKGYGDKGFAYGICQIDTRWHSIIGAPDSVEHISQADSILTIYLAQIKGNHPDWPQARQIQGAIAAYNMGVHAVQTLDGMDIGTTHNDYSNDVWARALFFAGY